MSEAVYFKQYGDFRTGSNWLRALMKHNFSSVYVLMHILGDKHSEPVPLRRLLEQLESSSERAENFVQQATFYTPAQTTDAADPEQLALMRELAEPVLNAVVSEKLRFLITVKAPVAWAVSLMRWKGWWSDKGGRQLASQPKLQAACQAYNRKHAAWLKLSQEAGARASIVRYEDLRSDPVGMLARLQQGHELTLSRPRLETIGQVVPPTHWDQHESRLHWAEFDPAYSSEAYHAEFRPELRQVVIDTIDWELMKNFGYSRPIVTK